MDYDPPIMCGRLLRLLSQSLPFRCIHTHQHPDRGHLLKVAHFGSFNLGKREERGVTPPCPTKTHSGGSSAPCGLMQSDLSFVGQESVTLLKSLFQGSWNKSRPLFYTPPSSLWHTLAHGTPSRLGCPRARTVGSRYYARRHSRLDYLHIHRFGVCKAFKLVILFRLHQTSHPQGLPPPQAYTNSWF